MTLRHRGLVACCTDPACYTGRVPATVCWSCDEARAVVAAGGLAVLVADPADPPPDLAALRAAGPGRVAVLVADPADPATAAAAGAMAAELDVGP